jgi:protein deglycase
MKTIAVLFAEGFEEIEAITIVDVLRRAEFEVILIGVSSLKVRGSHDIRVEMEKLLGEVSAEHLDAVVLPGGMPGAANLAKNKDVVRLLQEINSRQKPVGAICAAPIALQSAGLIAGKNVTCYPSFESQLVDAVCTGESVSVDENIITGKGPGAAIEFALTLVDRFGKPDTAADLRQKMIVS